MGDVKKQTVISAPIEAVFRYVSDPRNAPGYINSIEKIVSGPEGSPAQGQVWKAEATLMGRRSQIDLRLQRLDPPRAVAFAIDGDPAGVLSLQLRPGDGQRPQTHVALTLEVPKVPSIFLGAIMGALLEADIARLKARLES